MSSERVEGLMMKEPLTKVTEVSLERAGSRSEVVKIDSDGNQDRDPIYFPVDQNQLSGSAKEDLYNHKIKRLQEMLFKQGNAELGINNTNMAKELLKRAFTDGMIDQEMQLTSNTANKNVANHERSSLKQITTGNKTKLKPKEAQNKLESQNKGIERVNQTSKLHPNSASQNLFESLINGRDYKLKLQSKNSSPTGGMAPHFPDSGWQLDPSPVVLSSPLLPKSPGQESTLGRARLAPHPLVSAGRTRRASKPQGLKQTTPKSVTSDSIDNLDIHTKKHTPLNKKELRASMHQGTWNHGSELPTAPGASDSAARLISFGTRQKNSAVPFVGFQTNKTPYAGLLPRNGISSEHNIRKLGEMSPNSAKLKAFKKPSSEYSLHGHKFSKGLESYKVGLLSGERGAGEDHGNHSIGGSAKIIQTIGPGFVNKLKKQLAPPSHGLAAGEKNENLKKQDTKLKIPRTISGYSAALATSKGSETKQLSQDDTPERKNYKEPVFFNTHHPNEQRLGAFHQSIKKVGNKEIMNTIKPRSYSRPKTVDKPDRPYEDRKLSYSSTKFPTAPRTVERKSYKSRASCPEEADQISVEVLINRTDQQSLSRATKGAKAGGKQHPRRPSSTEGLRLDNPQLQAQLLNFNQVFAKLKVLATKNSRTLGKLQLKGGGGGMSGLFNFGLDRLQPGISLLGGKPATTRTDPKPPRQKPSFLNGLPAQATPSAAHTAKSSFLHSQSLLYTKRTPVSVFRERAVGDGDSGAVGHPDSGPTGHSAQSATAAEANNAGAVSSSPVPDDLEMMYRATIRRAAHIYKQIYKDECQE